MLKDNDIETHSTNNEEKSIVAERFIRTLKNKIYKHLLSVSKYVYIDKLDNIVTECNNTYHRTIKMKPIEVKNNTNTDSIKEVNHKYPKFKIGDHIRISIYKTFFAKVYTPISSEEFFVIKEVENTVSCTYVINGINVEKSIG